MAPPSGVSQSKSFQNEYPLRADLAMRFALSFIERVLGGEYEC